MSKEQDIIVVRCMDEDYDVPGEKGAGRERKDFQQLEFGFAGTAITRTGEGNQKVLPDNVRNFFAETRSGVFAGIKIIAQYMDSVVWASSHAGCGWAGAQAIEDVSKATLDLCQSNGIKYAGKAEYHSILPAQRLSSGLLKPSPVYAKMGRPESDHHHGASSAIVTTGGFITGSEISQTESSRYGDAFVIGADFAGPAIERHLLTFNEASIVVAEQMYLAGKLTEFNVSPSSIVSHNADRLKREWQTTARDVFNEALNILHHKR